MISKKSLVSLSVRALFARGEVRSIEFFYLAFIGLLASLTQASTGFGYAIVSMALWTLFLPFKDAAVIEAVTAFFMVVGLVVKLHCHINFKLLLFPLLSSIVTSYLGVLILMHTSESGLRRILGAALILLSVYMIIFSDRFRISPTPGNGFIAGSVSGLFNGMFNLGGPPVIAYFLSATDDKLEYNATLQCYFLFNVICLLFNHIRLGNLTVPVLQSSFIAMAGVSIGTVGGWFIFKKLSIPIIKKVVYAFMSFFGAYLVIAG